ncbi:hypothetical protein VFPPC_15766 [Pochonia chlamydosporia 170]|uniref:Uncharacterized protein n=1 Tax=Pochonia chlamydosporia 170 TaxID=1380566 RepID=A0A179FSA8_METCM|nr:hypothetical protein VFPPC_15766 [Pochonia chlamydosporia 170]OAQ68021.1 hypothetical protein VFPPC_15766 [Pochonia chlamydosporia 170]
MVPGTTAVWWRGDLPSRTKTKTTHQKYSQTEKFTFVSNSPSAELRAPNFSQSPRPERYSQAPGRTTTRFYPLSSRASCAHFYPNLPICGVFLPFHQPHCTSPTGAGFGGLISSSPVPRYQHITGLLQSEYDLYTLALVRSIKETNW